MEGDLARRDDELLAGRSGPAVHTYGISDDEAAGVGLMCGGTVRIFLEELQGEQRELMGRVLAAVDAGSEAAVATVLDGEFRGRRLAVIADRLEGHLGIDLFTRNVERATRGMLDQAETGIRRFGADGSTMGDEVGVYIQAFAEPPRLIIFGGIDFSVAAAAIARELGYRVTIVDAREPFIASPRFQRVAEVVVEWPDRYLEDVVLGPRDAVLVFTHDRKFDQPALAAALSTEAGYIGALGSRRTQSERRDRLREAGISDRQIDRIAAPCGLDIGARTPGETAVSIIAEIIAERNRRSGERLVETSGPIHGR